MQLIGCVSANAGKVVLCAPLIYWGEDPRDAKPVIIKRLLQKHALSTEIVEGNILGSTFLGIP